MIDILEELVKMYHLCIKYPKYKLNILARIKRDRLNDRLKIIDHLIEFNENIPTDTKNEYQRLINQYDILSSIKNDTIIHMKDGTVTNGKDFIDNLYKSRKQVSTKL